MGEEPFLLLPPALCAEHDAVWSEISLWSGGVSCPSYILSQLFVHPQPTRCQGAVRGRKGLTLLKPCSAVMKASLCHQHYFQHKFNR